MTNLLQRLAFVSQTVCGQTQSHPVFPVLKAMLRLAQRAGNGLLMPHRSRLGGV
jgi:hypothetical protein